MARECGYGFPYYIIKIGRCLGIFLSNIISDFIKQMILRVVKLSEYGFTLLMNARMQFITRTGGASLALARALTHETCHAHLSLTYMLPCGVSDAE